MTDAPTCASGVGVPVAVTVTALRHDADREKQIDIGIRVFSNIERLTSSQVKRGSAGPDVVATRGNIVKFVSVLRRLRSPKR